MKTIYKILFSLCSTLICVMHSARSFGASCGSHTLYTSVPSDWCGTPIWGYNQQATGCATYNTYYLKTGGRVNTTGVLECYNGATIVDCTACKTGYVTDTMVADVNSSYADCTLQTTRCIPKVDGNTTATCTSDSHCITKLGSSLAIAYFDDYETGELEVAYGTYKATCNTSAGYCAWVISAASTWIMDTGNGNGTLASAITCTNGHYGGNPILVSYAGAHTAQGCVACPDIDATYTGNPEYANYLDGGGTNIGKCAINGVAGETTFADTTGDFEIIGTCLFS